MKFGSPIVISETQGNGRYRPLQPVSVRRDDPNSFDEKLLQELINAAPNVLPVRDYLPSATTLFSLGREVPVDLGANQGFIDNLLVTNDGFLVIVETKLYRNPEGIRDVIAQTLQYGMAVGQMPLTELELRIKRGQFPSPRSAETVSDCVIRQANEQNCSGALSDDFDEALEHHLRRGEILLLIVSDGIHVGVERVTHWLNEQGNSSPFKFGLVELKFYAHGDERLVVPRTVLKTREISRHVVIVDVRAQAGTEATALVQDDYLKASGGRAQETRTVKAGSTPITKTELLQKATPEDATIIAELIEQLDGYGFDQSSTKTFLQFGFCYPDEGDFHPLTYLGRDTIWTQVPKPVRDLMSDDQLRGFHLAANQFGAFYRGDQIDKPHSTGSAVKYQSLQQSLSGYVAFVDSCRNQFLELLQKD